MALFEAGSAAKVGLALLQADLVLGNIVDRTAESGFGGKSGSTVRVPYPASLQAHTRPLDDTAAIVVDTLDETALPITLDVHAYSAVRLSDADLTLRLESYAAEVLRPQVAAVAKYVEQTVADAIAGLPVDATITFDPANPRKALLSARSVLRGFGVPAGGMYAIVSPDVAEAFLSDAVLVDAGASGNTDALREATIGRLAGATVVESNLMAAGSLVLMHAAAVSLAVVAPAIPEGASFGASVDEGGFALRYLRDYSANDLSDRSIVSTFVGSRVNTMTALDGSTVTPAVKVTV